MAMTPGRWVSLSPHRRLLSDLLRLTDDTPLLVVERRFQLGDLFEARRQAQPRPSWSILFARAFALVAAGTPALRRSYAGLLRPHLYEHPEPVALIAVERVHHGEELVVFSQMRHAHTLPLAELDARLRSESTASLQSVGSFRRTLRMGRFPWPLRGWLLRLALRSGPLRERQLGTFIVTSPASSGAGGLEVRTLAPNALHYGLFDESGSVDVRLSVDYRVVSGRVAARTLTAMEQTLCGPILDEVRAL